MIEASLQINNKKLHGDFNAQLLLNVFNLLNTSFDNYYILFLRQRGVGYL